MTITGSLATMLVAGLAISPSANADSRIVGPDGNLLVLDTPGVVRTITPDGDSSTFPIADGTRAEVLANGPGEKVSMVARASSDSSALPSLYRFDTSGAFDIPSIELGPIMARTGQWFSGRDMAIAPDGSTYVSQGWAPCTEPEPGNIAKISPSGVVSMIEGPIDFEGTGIYPEGPIEVDGAGRLWIDGNAPRDVECGEHSAGWSGSLFVGYITPDGKTHRTHCGWGYPKMAVTTDGAAWCLDSGRLYRMGVEGEIRSYDLPEGWTDPDHMRPGPDGSLWFASLTEVDDECGCYVPPWTIASLSPSGELRTYPSLQEDLVEDIDTLNFPPYVTLYDWYFTNDDRIWLLKRPRRGANPFHAVIDLPRGESQGVLANRADTFPEPPPVDDPDPPPPDPPLPQVRLDLSVGAPKVISRKQLRKTREIPLRLTTGVVASVKVSATIGNRLGKKIGLRAKKSRNKTRIKVAGIAVPVRYNDYPVLTLGKRKVAKLTSRKSSIRIDTTATAGGQYAVSRRTVVIK